MRLASPGRGEGHGREWSACTANKVFGKRISRSCSQTSSRLVFQQDPGVLHPDVIFVGLIEVFRRR
jgi:hypothetical protein